jgi:PAS domain-containing protein
VVLASVTVNRMADVGASVPTGEMPSPLLWALVIVAFGVLLIVCVLILLRRQSDDLVTLDARAITGTGMGRHVQHLHRLLRAIRAINNVIVGERDAQRLMERACHTLTTTRGYKMAWIGLVEEGTKRVRPAASAGVENGYLDRIEITWDEAETGLGPTGSAIRSGEPSVMRDIETAPEFRPWRDQALERGFRSSAALPLRCRGRVMGALNVYSEMPDSFDIEEIGLLQEVADHLAYALAAIELQDDLLEARRRARASRRARRAFERAPVGIATSDKDGVITSINPAMLRLFGRVDEADDIVDRLSLVEFGLFGASDPASTGRARRREQATALPRRAGVRRGARAGRQRVDRRRARAVLTPGPRRSRSAGETDR